MNHEMHTLHKSSIQKTRIYVCIERDSDQEG